MKYKVGDKVRIRGDLNLGEYGNNIFTEEMQKYKGEIKEITDSAYRGYKLDGIGYFWTPEMLRPAEFKIWCETEEEKQAVLEELEKEGYKWSASKLKPTKSENGRFTQKESVGLIVEGSGLLWINDGWSCKEEKYVEISPSEFTGIDFLEKIVITKTANGASGTCGNKTAEAEGDFAKSARQVFAELICPFKIGDTVGYRGGCAGKIEKISSDYTALVVLHGCQSWYDFDDLEPYKEPLFGGRAVFSKRSKDFTKGKIYEFKRGFTIDDSGDKRPISDSDVVKNTEMLERYGFIAIVEDK